jgi:hypothetical protein
LPELEKFSDIRIFHDSESRGMENVCSADINSVITGSIYALACWISPMKLAMVNSPYLAKSLKQFPKPRQKITSACP